MASRSSTDHWSYACLPYFTAATRPSASISTSAGILSEARRRVSAIYEVVRSAAGVDTEVGELWTELSQQRLAGAKEVATLLSRKGGLRSGLSVAQARDIIWVYNDPGLHHALVGTRRWSQTKYSDWLAGTLKCQLLGGL